MTRLNDLKKSLVAMSPEELRDQVRKIRTDRKLKKEPTKAKKERVRTADSAKTGLMKLLAGLSPEEREAMLQELGG